MATRRFQGITMFKARSFTGGGASFSNRSRRTGETRGRSSHSKRTMTEEGEKE